MKRNPEWNMSLFFLLTPLGLFNFDGFRRQGLGALRQLQMAVKLTFSFAMMCRN